MQRLRQAVWLKHHNGRVSQRGSRCVWPPCCPFRNQFNFLFISPYIHRALQYQRESQWFPLNKHLLTMGGREKVTMVLTLEVKAKRKDDRETTNSSSKHCSGGACNWWPGACHSKSRDTCGKTQWKRTRRAKKHRLQKVEGTKLMHATVTFKCMLSESFNKDIKKE